MDSDWRDGFLFVGNALALDFLNTRPVINGTAEELLSDTNALVRWLTAAPLIKKEIGMRLHRQWSALTEEEPLSELTSFREQLRKAVCQIEAGGAPSNAFLGQLNSRLREHPLREKVAVVETGLERRTHFHPRIPQDTFQPLAHAVVQLLTGADLSRLRKCQNCVLHFYDTSKKGTRAWCSMKMCGNRSKVAAYAERKRSGV